MANEGSSNTAMVIVFLIVILAIAGFFVYRGGYFSREKNINIDVKVPSATSTTPSAPSAPSKY